MYDDNDRKDYPDYSVNNNSEDENRERNAGMYSGSRYDYTNRTGQSSFTTGQTSTSALKAGSWLSSTRAQTSSAVPSLPATDAKTAANVL